jgi:hypothetical protein
VSPEWYPRRAGQCGTWTVTEVHAQRCGKVIAIGDAIEPVLARSGSQVSEMNCRHVVALLLGHEAAWRLFPSLSYSCLGLKMRALRNLAKFSLSNHRSPPYDWDGPGHPIEVRRSSRESLCDARSVASEFCSPKMSESSRGRNSD